jgi:RHS repeat-associated protein
MNFVWDLGFGLPRILDDGTQYVYGAAAGPLEQVTPSGTFTYLADGLGSTLATTNASGAVVQSYSYDAYGAVSGSSGSQPTEYQFAGQETEASGLQYLRARYYDPSTGRFLGRDPGPALVGVPQTGNRYAYALGGPTGKTDRTGRECDSGCFDEAGQRSLGGGDFYCQVNPPCADSSNVLPSIEDTAEGIANFVVNNPGCDIALVGYVAGTVAGSGPEEYQEAAGWVSNISGLSGLFSC